MEQILKWLMTNMHSSQSTVAKYARNWPWLMVGLILLTVII